jgi:transcriptional regulator with XRE-family HTH domain
VHELRRLRDEQGLSLRELSDASGVDQASISQIENDRRSPNVATLQKLAAGLGVEVADFFPKASPPLFELPPQRAGILERVALEGQPLSRKELAGWQVSSIPTTPRMRRILAGVQSGETTPERAASALAAEILDMLRAGGVSPAGA